MVSKDVIAALQNYNPHLHEKDILDYARCLADDTDMFDIIFAIDTHICSVYQDINCDLLNRRAEHPGQRPLRNILKYGQGHAKKRLIRWMFNDELPAYIILSQDAIPPLSKIITAIIDNDVEIALKKRVDRTANWRDVHTPHVSLMSIENQKLLLANSQENWAVLQAATIVYENYMAYVMKWYDAELLQHFISNEERSPFYYVCCGEDEGLSMHFIKPLHAVNVRDDLSENDKVALKEDYFEHVLYAPRPKISPIKLAHLLYRTEKSRLADEKMFPRYTSLQVYKDTVTF